MAEPREIAIALHGATGYTGRLIAHLLADASGVSFVLVGRSRARLDALAKELSSPPAHVLATDGLADPEAALREIFSKTSVCIGAAGPFRYHADVALQAALDAGADWIDVCGEPDWIGSTIRRFEAKAKKTGSLVVHSCGADSVGPEAGALFTSQGLGAQCPARSIACYHSVLGGPSMSNGTLLGAVSFMLDRLPQPPIAPGTPTPLLTPFELGNSRKDAPGLPAKEHKCPVPGYETQSAIPYMTPDNAICRWSLALQHREQLSPALAAAPPVYRQYTIDSLVLFWAAPRKNLDPSGSRRLLLCGLTLIVVGIAWQLLLPAVLFFGGSLVGKRTARERCLRRIAEAIRGRDCGPNAELVPQTKNIYLLHAVSIDTDADGVECTAAISSARVTCGEQYEFSAKAVVQGALCLLQDRADLPLQAGVAPPAAAMGTAFIQRLESSGTASFERL